MQLTGNVLITGGSGFLGRAILRRAKREGWDWHPIIYSRDEVKQWEVKYRYPEATCILGDISHDVSRLIAAMAGVETVLNFAAVKFIPEAEQNVSETIDVNIIGSRNVMVAAIASGVQTVIATSTDKACQPTTLYGTTKLVMERLFGEANRIAQGRTSFATVRYGNVVGSTGSVIPVFRRQARDFGELRVTDERMTRFWLSVDEAIDVILEAYSLMRSYGGHTFIPRCPAMRIVDLASAVWTMERQNGIGKTTPNIKFTGIRPSEKLHEMLISEAEVARAGSWMDKTIILAPATETTFRMEPHIPVGPYSSDAPARWMQQDEMIQLIKDSEQV